MRYLVIYQSFGTGEIKQVCTLRCGVLEKDMKLLFGWWFTGYVELWAQIISVEKMEVSYDTRV